MFSNALVDTDLGIRERAVMAEGRGEEHLRATVTVSEAAEQLGLSPSRVHQMLEQSGHPLTGPPKTGRGRGRRRFVYVDSLKAELSRRQAARDGTPRGARRQDQVMRMAAELTELRARIVRLEGGDDAPAGNAAELRWALQQLNAVTDLLHEAAHKESTVRRLQVEVTDRLNAALLQMGESSELVRRADRIRSEVIGAMLAPQDVGNG